MTPIVTNKRIQTDEKGGQTKEEERFLVATLLGMTGWGDGGEDRRLLWMDSRIRVMVFGEVASDE